MVNGLQDSQKSGYLSNAYEDWSPEDIGPANTLVAQYGGKSLARTSSHERLEDEGAALRIIIEWSSKEAALGLRFPCLQAEATGLTPARPFSALLQCRIRHGLG